MVNYFYETEDTLIELIKTEIEEMANILICGKEIITICDICGIFAHKNLKYKVYYYYPNITVESDEIEEKNLCKYCLKTVELNNKVIEKKE